MSPTNEDDPVVHKFFAALQPKMVAKIMATCLNISIEEEDLGPISEWVAHPYYAHRRKYDILLIVWGIAYRAKLVPPVKIRKIARNTYGYTGNYEQFCSTLPESTAEGWAFLISIWETMGMCPQLELPSTYRHRDLVIDKIVERFKRQYERQHNLLMRAFPVLPSDMVGKVCVALGNPSWLTERECEHVFLNFARIHDVME